MREFTTSGLARSPLEKRRAACCAALLTIVALVAAGCDENGAPTGATDASPATAAESTSLVGQRIGTLIAPRDVSFAVVFTAQELWPFTVPEYLFWRQGQGAARWDIVPSGPDAPARGWFFFDGDTAADQALPYTGMNCLWFRQTSPGPDGTPQAHVSCSEGGRPPGVLFGAIAFRITGALPDDTVAGRRASCYSFRDPELTKAVFCADSSEGIPLLLSTVGLRDPRLTQDMRALTVSTAEQQLRFPVQLEMHPVLHDWAFEGTVPISTLQLPDLSEFQG